METIIGLICLTHLFIVAEPSILIKRWLGFREEEYDKMTPTKRFIHKLITCHLCSGFWIGLLTGNLFIAAIVSIGSELLCKIMRRI